MKAHTFTLILFSAVLLITGCKKEDIGDPFPKIRTRVDDLGYTYTYTYRGDGKLLKMYGSDGYKSEYTYAKGVVTINNMAGEDNVSTPYIKLELNDKGLVTKETFDSAYTILHEYNGDNKLQRSVYPNRIEEITWIDGNIVRSESDGILLDYTYYTDNANMLSDRVYGFDFFGNDSKNLLKSTTVTANGETYTSNYTYEFDSKGRITKKIDTRSVGVVRTETFTYY